MNRASILVCAALVLVTVTTAQAEQPFTGTVNRIDPGAGVILFDDGRMLQTTADSVIISGNRHVAFGTLVPGGAVTVYQAQPVALRDGRYVLLSELVSPVPSTATVVSPPRTAIVPPPALPAAVITAPVTTASVSAQPLYEASGVVRRTDATSHVIALSDGRKLHLTPDTVVLVNNRPVQIDTLRAGTPIVVLSSSPFAGGQPGSTYTTMQPVATGTVARVDPGRDIVLTDGRTFSLLPDTAFMIGNQPVTATSLQPGMSVVVYEKAEGIGAAASPEIAYPEGGLREWVSPMQAP